MSLIDSRDLAMMRADQTDALWDTCIVQTQSATVDSYGQGIETFTDGTAIACRFIPWTGGELREINRSDGTITVIRAEVRLPLGTTVTAKDRIKITKRFGETLTTALVFGANEPGAIGPTCVTVSLKDVD